ILHTSPEIICAPRGGGGRGRRAVVSCGLFGYLRFCSSRASSYPTRGPYPRPPFLAGVADVSLFIHMEGIAELWEQLKTHVRVLMPLKDQWYGMTEFTIAD